MYIYCTMNDFYDLQKSPQMEDRLTFEIVTTLMDQVFGEHEHMVVINMETETSEHHEIIRKHWGLLTKYVKLPYTVKKTQKLVRQTFMQITDYLNDTYHFVKPVKFDRKRHDYRRKEDGKKTADFWNEFTLK